MNTLASHCTCVTHPIDWVCRGFVGLWIGMFLLAEWEARRSRPRRDTVQALADGAERRFGADALHRAHGHLQAMRRARDARRYRLVKAVADELLRRSLKRPPDHC